jgi:4-hydroxy 2-oxovalerate aldolase
MDSILVFDATLRDGSHAVKHQLSLANIGIYCHAADEVGFHTIVVGHGNGLGASSLQVGLSLNTDYDMLSTARDALQKTKLGAFMLPGYGTIEDDIIPAIECGVEVFKVGCHCSEANITKQHIEYIRKAGKEVYGVLMLSHMLDSAELAEQALKMEEYGAMGVILMDSAGTLMPEDVVSRVRTLKSNLAIRVGFHAHNNLGMAAANTMAAISHGATIIDGTTRGFGAGAGNCQLEAVLVILKKYGIDLGIDINKLMDVSENVVAKLLQKDPQGLSSVSLMSGYAGIVSTFNEHVKRLSKDFGVSTFDVFEELGKRKPVAGQEDMIIQVVEQLAKEKKSNGL